MNLLKMEKFIESQDYLEIKCGEVFYSRKTLLFQCTMCVCGQSFDLWKYLKHILKKHGYDLTTTDPKYSEIFNYLSESESDELALEDESQVEESPLVCVESIEVNMSSLLEDNTLDIMDNPEQETALVEIEQIEVLNTEADEEKEDVISLEENYFECINRSPKMDILQCANCLQKFSESKELTSHVRVCCNKQLKSEKMMCDLTLFDPASPLKCKKCNQTFLSIYTLKTHFLRRHSDLKCFQCSLCDISYRLSSQLVDHVRSTHSETQQLKKEKDDSIIELYANEIEVLNGIEVKVKKDSTASVTLDKILSCNQCDKQFKRHQDLIVHRRSHSRIFARPHLCPECGQTFKSAAIFELHQERMHPKQVDEMSRENISPVSSDHIEITPATEEELASRNIEGTMETKCEICNKEFSSKSSLYVHMLRHQNKKKHACNLCSKEFVTAGDRDRHARSHSLLKEKEPKERKHKCRICGIAFTDVSNMKAHEKRHSENNKKISCNYCSKKFFTNTEKLIHHRMHTKEHPFLCHNCGRGFVSSGQLSAHMRRHRNERNYKCEICDKAFFDKTLLTDHLQCHRDTRDFKCSHCNATFKRHKTLKQHMKIHENLRKYKCRLCGAGFNQNPGLRSHMKSKHGL